MRSKAIVSLTTSVVVSLSAVSLALADDRDRSRKFADRAAGAYFAELDATPLGLPGVTLPAVLTLHADGTAIGIDASDEGAGSLLPFNSMSQGNWVRDGRRGVNITGLFLSYENPDTPVPHGVLRAISKLNIAVEFSNDFGFGQGYACQQNVEITGGLYNPSTDNPLALPDIECNADFPGAIPAVAWRIQ